MEMTLECGTVVSLHALRQYLTYEGLIEGLPTAERNQQLLKGLLSEQSYPLYNVPPYLIEPIERPLEYIEGKRYPFGTPSALPSVTCIARFESRSPTKGSHGDFSGLVVIWFQDRFSFPIDPAVLTRLNAIDWDMHAGSYKF